VPVTPAQNALPVISELAQAPVVPAQAVVKEQAPAPAPVAAKPVAVVKPVIAPKAAAKPEKAVAAPAITKVAATPKASSGGTGWYASQAPSSYVVQVLGTGAEANAQAFVREQGAQYHYFKKQLQGKSLYVVTYGGFTSRSAAQAAISNLPAKLKAGGPWPRTIASIQAEMK
jgi:DamX protein